MAWLGIIVALLVILIVLVDTFEVMLLPRRVTHGFRLARIYYRSAWVVWRAFARLYPAGRRRNGILGCFGPLSLIGLMLLWALGLIFGFAILFWSLRDGLSLPSGETHRFITFFYFSGTNFFTLGYGDALPITGWSRALSMLEAGMGLGFLAVVISYLPVLYQAFSKREITISLLDARAGSPPTAGELLRRFAAAGSLPQLRPLLVDWERWAAELLESHLSFPVLSFYRSQHDNQSWLATLTVILDTSALLIAGATGADNHQARLTFAMARHAAVDLCLIFQSLPLPLDASRVTAEDLADLQNSLRQAGATISDNQNLQSAIAELRALYEPFILALAKHLQLAIPRIQPSKPPVDNWQTSPWKQQSPALGDLPTAITEADHFG